ncbi:YafY family transcriptional regulator [Devosia oryziradicis]|uniref:YafY family transcriptional regulator n=1 Tax=Devosia oryziradicis TaxID=2801335 RepID=A0ABX7BT57_9HYPH|nr:YafY family protein [Devosia oryziradicis]QQR35135.1 YafY family transcriptional regulator [Devosia oryziradicis]
MSRTARLLDLLQLLRNRSTPITGPALAQELGISIRSLYRDIATLQAQGADIIGEPGLGYVLRPGFTLPPLMFSADEIEAIVLGSRWVAARADDGRLSQSAKQALSKITAVLPAELRERAEATNLLVARMGLAPATIDAGIIRLAIRNERKLIITYRGPDDTETERTIWPFLIGFFEQARLVAAWCELRQGYRHFRIDRISHVEATEVRYPRRRAVMLKEWRAEQNVPPPA